MLSEERIRIKRDTSLYWQRQWEKEGNHAYADIYRKEVDLYNEVLEGEDEREELL